jgi:hypothetical protein
VTEIAVLGCGPAGLLAAYAVEKAGHTPYIVSIKEKSVLPGSLHLRESIDGLTNIYPDRTVTIVRMGSPKGYAQKVYGDRNRYTGWDNYDRTYPSWNVQTAYDKLWDIYQGRIDNRTITPMVLQSLGLDYPLVISTIPQPHLCMEDHVFDSVPYWIRDLPTPEEEIGRELIVYNGLPSDPWYRFSVLGDRTALEYSAQPADYGSSAVSKGVKAIGNNCDCWPSIIRAGRWAQWSHGVLLNHAYHKALQAAERIA